jgi:hypothetical protein
LPYASRMAMTRIALLGTVASPANIGQMGVIAAASGNPGTATRATI